MEARFFPSGTFAPVAALSQLEAFDVPDAPEPPGHRPLHDPPLPPRDEAVFLLTAVAEIEHALMVQYLYAAYSIKVPDPESVQQRLQDLLVEIAREEMGHLITVQNLLLLIGGQLNLGRDSGPYGSAIYPFQFQLEPLSTDSLAKYVTAESPDPLPELHILSYAPPDEPGVLAPFTPEDWELVRTLQVRAKAVNGGKPVRHVGGLFQRLLVLFGNGDAGMKDEDFRKDEKTEGRQAKEEDWGYDTLDREQGKVIVDAFTGDVAALRTAAIASLREIADQGEGVNVGKDRPGESHFERFFAIYRTVDRLRNDNVELTWRIPSNPNTSGDPTPDDVVDQAVEDAAAPGRIRDPRARAWAQMFNLRYRMLLGRLGHFLLIDQAPYVGEGPQQGDRTARGLLLLGAFDEMRHLRKIAAKLVTMRKGPGEVEHAAPPFEMPYTLNLPDDEDLRWRTHLDVSRAAVALAERSPLKEDDDPFLAALTSSDRFAQKALTELAAGRGIPSDTLPTGFVKAVTILDEAVRGFRVAPERCRHGDFWAGRTRDEFVRVTVAGVPVLLDRNGKVVENPDDAELIRRMTDRKQARRMPLLRPSVPPSRLAYLKEWISKGAPDGVPPEETFTKEPEPSPPPPVEIDGGPADPPS